MLSQLLNSFTFLYNVLYNIYVYFLKLLSFDSICFFCFGKFKFDFIVSEFFLCSFSVSCSCFLKYLLYVYVDYDYFIDP